MFVGKKTTLFILLLFGIALRLIWVEDMEYKGDEIWMFNKTQTVGVSEPWPTFGMLSGIGTPNPGMSAWVFIALAKIFHITKPTELARAVQGLNIAALILLLFFALKVVPQNEKMIWIWAFALVCVNPTAVLFHRKIWAQCALPFFSMLTIFGFWFRYKKSGAFLWGLFGAILGQVHMSGFFFSFGIFLWTVLFQRKNVCKNICWMFWILGSLLGAIPMIPWILYTWQTSVPTPAGFRHILQFKFFRFWFTDTLGTRLSYSLHAEHYKDFLSYPLLLNKPTYFVGLLHGATFFIGFYILFKSIFRFLKNRFSLISFLSGSNSSTFFLINAVFWGMGIFLTATNFYIERHYMIVTFPLEFVWLCGLALKYCRKASMLLGTLCVLEFLISINFLNYIHINCGAPQGDYGVAYRCRKD